MTRTIQAKDESRIIVALDVPSAEAAWQLLDQLDARLCKVKVGKQLFTRCGPDLVRKIVDRGFDVFLDLKFHDIPNTVSGAVQAAADLGVWMLNVHAAGGRAMMMAAADALQRRGTDAPLLIAVTVLTSLGADGLAEVGLAEEPDQLVKRLALLTVDCGLDGVVCSARETVMLNDIVPDEFCLVTPGIRRPEDAAGDQVRVVGPAQAITDGSSYLVVGRPITQAESPRESLAVFNAAVAGVL